MCKNRLYLAAAGSGKTTFLINEALQVKKGKVLILTYTNANEMSLKERILKYKDYVTDTIVVQCWYPFLLKHGARPYQGSLNSTILKNNKIKGIYFDYNPENIRYISERDYFEDHYFTKNLDIYSERVAKLVVKCDECSNNAVIQRISQIFSHIFIDEVQDMAGSDLDFIKLLFKSQSKIILVGDPRQVIYRTHSENKYRQYRDGKIKDFFTQKCQDDCIIDETKLNCTYRNNREICDIANKIYPEYKSIESANCKKTFHDGVYVIRSKDVEKYLSIFNPVQLRWDKRKIVNKNYKYYNFGEAKGLEFERVLIYPTVEMERWICGKSNNLDGIKKSKFYVAITRAKYSVAIIYDYKPKDNFIEGILKYETPLSAST